jgi:hypothetical protein
MFPEKSGAGIIDAGSVAVNTLISEIILKHEPKSQPGQKLLPLHQKTMNSQQLLIVIRNNQSHN